LVSCDESSLVYVVPPDFADAGVVARDDAGFLAAPAGPREAGAPLALPVGLASLSQQVSPGVTESSSRVGLALPTARRRGAGGLDAGLSGACLSRACLGRRASAVASSVKGRVGGRVGGQRGERSRADPTKIGHKWTILIRRVGDAPMGDESGDVLPIAPGRGRAGDDEPFLWVTIPSARLRELCRRPRWIGLPNRQLFGKRWAKGGTRVAKSTLKTQWCGNRKIGKRSSALCQTAKDPPF
jgi:hypothetical protein